MKKIIRYTILGAICLLPLLPIIDSYKKDGVLGVAIFIGVMAVTLALVYTVVRVLAWTFSDRCNK